MMAELIINNEDAFETWGVRMGSGFLEAILLAAPVKAFVENSNSYEHGKTVADHFFRDKRDVSLTFTIEGDTQTEYLTRYKAFMAELYNVRMSINVPALGTETYHLLYKKAASIDIANDRSFCKLVVKFEEPDPTDRKQK